MHDVEIDQKSDPPAAQAHIGEQLSLVNRIFSRVPTRAASTGVAEKA
jgi:hypothetical protein